MMPAVIMSGFSVKITQSYRPQIWTGWVLMIIGMALMTFVKLENNVGLAVAFAAIYGIGAG